MHRCFSLNRAMHGSDDDDSLNKSFVIEKQVFNFLFLYAQLLPIGKSAFDRFNAINVKQRIAEAFCLSRSQAQKTEFADP